LSIAIALYGISALTRKRWLLLMASGLAAFGILLNVAGFVGWSIHPEFLATSSRHAWVESLARV
jgi:hypothetical protein